MWYKYIEKIRKESWVVCVKAKASYVKIGCQSVVPKMDNVRIE